MIHHLSYPKGGSVTDGIDPQFCAATYTSFDAAISWVRKYGQGSLMPKSDIELTFRLLPVHPQSLHLLGCYWQGSYFGDRCLLMGCSISCALFEAISSFLGWTFREVVGVNPVIHYLDDFLYIGPPMSHARRYNIWLGCLAFHWQLTSPKARLLNWCSWALPLIQWSWNVGCLITSSLHCVWRCDRPVHSIRSH